MLDRLIRPLIDPWLDRAGRPLAALGISADAVTLAGLAAGLGAAALIAAGRFLPALALLLVSRLLDGLDGAVARAGRRTDFGGYLDILADFAFYAAIPLGFVALDPAANGLAGAFLLATFYVNGGALLGYAALAERRRLAPETPGAKNLHFSTGLLEGTETIAFFVALCLLPAAFAPLAVAFGALTLATTVGRIARARRRFR